MLLTVCWAFLSFYPGFDNRLLANAHTYFKIRSQTTPLTNGHYNVHWAAGGDKEGGEDKTCDFVGSDIC